MKIVFADHAWDDFTYWVDHDSIMYRPCAGRM